MPEGGPREKVRNVRNSEPDGRQYAIDQHRPESLRVTSPRLARAHASEPHVLPLLSAGPHPVLAGCAMVYVVVCGVVW